ncbi:MAG: hypothetical protein ACI4UX_00615 [Clostridia bacterium]
MKKGKGITLIALIITIIVMLILVGVTVTVAINGGLFKISKESASKTEQKVLEEQNIIDETTIAQAACLHEWSWKVEGIKKDEEVRFKSSRKCSKCGKEQSFMLGAYVEGYDPSIGENDEIITTTYVSEGAKTGGTKETDKTTDGSKGNGYGNQEFAVTSMDLWKVIGEDEEGRLIIMSDEPVKTIEDNNFYLCKQAGYLNGISELNKISSIYGQGKYADKTLYPVGNETENASGARSIKVEDTNYRTEKSTYEIKEDENGTKCLYLNGNKCTTHVTGDTARLEYFDEKTQEWKTLDYGDEPVTFIDIVRLGWASVLVSGNYYNVNTIIMQDSNATIPNCWFATKTSRKYYAATYGNSIFGGRRSGPVAESTIDVVRFGYSNAVQPIVYLKADIEYEYNEETNTYKILGYKK